MQEGLSRLQGRLFKVDIVFMFSLLIVPTVLSIAGVAWYKNHTAAIATAKSQIDKMTGVVITKTRSYLDAARIQTELATEIFEQDHQRFSIPSKLEDYLTQVVTKDKSIDLFYCGREDGSFLQAAKLREDEPLYTTWIDRSGDNNIQRQHFYDDDLKLLREQTGENVEYDPRKRPWYIASKRENKTIWTDLYVFAENGKLGLTVASPVYQGEKLYGIAAADITLEGISSFLRQLSISPRSLAFIMDESGRFVAYPDPNQMVRLQNGEIVARRPVELNQPFITRAIHQFERDKEQAFSYELEGENYLARFTPFLEEFDKKWTLVMLVPETDFTGHVIETNQIIVILSLSILILAIVSGIFFARNLSKPIEALTREVANIQDFNLESSAPVKTYIHEISQMANAVESMKSGLRSFKKFVPSDLVRQLVVSGEEVEPGGVEKELTLFFTDIADFTTISEKIPARELMIHLSNYLQIMADCIQDQKGTLDKYIGDAVMAFWNAPLPLEDHAKRACLTALECKRRLRQFNDKLMEESGMRFHTRIGIHTGFTIVGNMGSRDRLNYTVLGDNVNLAARLEGVNKCYGTEILISADTYKYVRRDFVCRPVDLIAVKGKSNSVQIYELMGVSGEDEKMQSLANATASFVEMYLKRQWKEARDLIISLQREYPNDNLLTIYLDRCEQCIRETPDNNWSGIVRLDSK